MTFPGKTSTAVSGGVLSSASRSHRFADQSRPPAPRFAFHSLPQPPTAFRSLPRGLPRLDSPPPTQSSRSREGGAGPCPSPSTYTAMTRQTTRHMAPRPEACRRRPTRPEARSRLASRLRAAPRAVRRMPGAWVLAFERRAYTHWTSTRTRHAALSGLPSSDSSWLV